MDRGWRGAGVVAVVLTVSACDAAPELPPEARITYDTIDGVEHVISGARGTWASAERWTVDADAGVTIGQLEGGEAYTFGNVTGVAVAPDGRIYVADAQALEMRVYSSDGEFLFRFGRNGEGPGEFGNISGLRLAPEGIAVVDGQQARLTVFDLEGELIRTFRLERPYLIFDVGAPMGFEGDGVFHDRSVIRTSEGPDSVVVVRYGAEGEVLDTARVGARGLDYILITRDGRGVLGMVRPFTALPSLAFGPGGEAYFARGDSYRVTAFTPAGDVARVIRRGVRPRPVTAEERDSVRAWILEQARDVGGDVPEDLEIPTEKAIIAALHVDDAGNLWIQGQPDPDWSRLEWWVHDPEGRYLGVVVTPRMQVMHIGEDFVAGVTTDELGVDRVVVARLGK